MCRRSSVAVGILEENLVGTRRVAQCEVARSQARLTSILAADAFAFEHHVNEEHRDARARHVQPRMANCLGIGIDLGDGHLPEAGAAQAAAEIADVDRIGDQRRE